MITRVYYWLWHDLLRLHEPISWIIVHHVRENLLVWDLVGSLTLSTLWVLLMHFVAMK